MPREADEKRPRDQIGTSQTSATKKRHLALTTASKYRHLTTHPSDPIPSRISVVTVCRYVGENMSNAYGGGG